LVVHTSGVDVIAGTFAIKTITSLSVSPANQTLPVYSVQRFAAIATNSDQTTEDISASVSWSSSATSVGTISSSGIFTTVAQGQTTIQATFGSLNGSTTLTIQGRSFLPVGSFIQARQAHTATLLPDGTVLLAGGYGGYAGSGSYDVLSSAEIYNPTTKAVSGTNGYLSTPRQNHTATLLPNGKVLLVGGVTPMPGGGGYYEDTATAELYDPTSGTFTPTGSLNNARDSQAAVLLQNGTVLIVGGYQYNEGYFGATTSAEIYDPSTGQFTNTTGSLSYARAGCTATLLSNGTVLVVGGVSSFDVWSSSEIFDPSTGQFSPGPNLPAAEYGQSATTLSNGTVMLAGGTTTWMGSPWANVQIYNPSTNSFSAIQSMAVARFSQTATVLNDGTVLLVGGDASSNNYNTAELFQPATGTFLGAGTTADNIAGCSGCMPIPGTFLHTATLLNDGTVLIAGGNLQDGTLQLYETGLRVPLSLQITPGSASMTDGGTQQFVATDDLGNQRSDATWSISDSTVASLQSPTQPSVTAVKPGQVTLTANVDGVEAQAPISVAPVSVQVTPVSATLLIGGTRQFTAVDEKGRPSNIATWTVSNTSVATMTSASSPTLTANAAGTATLTATIVGVSAQGQVTVSGLATLAPGTAIWTTPVASGFTPTQIAQAVPTATGPGGYSVQASADGTQTMVQSFTADGQQLAQTTLRALVGTAVPDAVGGLLTTETCDSANPMVLKDLDASTLQPDWDVTITLANGGGSGCPLDSPKIAIRQDGAIAVAAPQNTLPSLVLLAGTTGQPILSPTIPTSSGTDMNGNVIPIPATMGQPIVDPSGLVFVEYAVRQVPYPPTSVASQLYLLQIGVDGSTSTVEVSTSDNSNLLPGTLMPDGNGGVLATWTINTPSPLPPAPQPYQAADIVSGTIASSYPMPSAPTQVATDPDGLPVNPALVLGENGIGFATYGSGNIVSFNVASGAVNWNYNGPQSVSSIFYSNGGGLILIDGQSNQVPIDPSGNAGTPIPMAFADLQPSWDGSWQGASTSSGVSMASVAAPVMDWGNSLWAAQKGSPSPASGSFQMPPFPPLSSCPGAQTPCTLEALGGAMVALRQLMAGGTGTCPNCASQVFGKVGSSYDQTDFSTFLQLTPRFYDGTRSSLPANSVCDSQGFWGWLNWLTCSEPYSFPGCSSSLSLSQYMKCSGSTALTATPSAHGRGLMTFFDPAGVYLVAAGTPTGILNQALLFHEGLHGYTGHTDGDLLSDFGYDPVNDPSCDITTYLETVTWNQNLNACQ